MEWLAPHRDGQAQALPVALPDDEPYLILPEPLVLDLRDSPLAVGIYLLVGRAFLVQQGPIPLSTTDIDAYDGSGDLRRGAILRALARLCDRGYLIPQSKQRRGLKATYLPGWGFVNGAPRPWSLEAVALDRPRAVRAVRVPRSVLDVCLGRLIPHLRHPALIERYVTRPPVSLRDLGSYGLSWAGLTMPTPALTRLGLVGPSGPLPPPTWELLLARISQQPLFDADPKAPTLSPRGLQRAGFHVSPAATPAEGDPIFFLPSNLIGSVIPPMILLSISQGIAMTSADEATLSAAGSGKSGGTQVPESTTGTQGNLANSGNEATPAPTPTAGGSSRASVSGKTTRRPPVQPAQTYATFSPQATAPADGATALAPAAITPAEQALRDLGLYPSVAQQYRELPLPLIERAQTIAQRLPGRRSFAATIAQLLREELMSPGWLHKARPDLFIGPMREDPAGAEASEAFADQGEETPCGRIYALLCDMLGRVGMFIELEHVSLEADRVAVRVPSWFSPAERAEVRSALHAVAAQLGLRIDSDGDELPAPSLEPPALASERSQPAPVPVAPPLTKSERPDWINPEQWGQLHLMARGALAGSRWEDERIVGAVPKMTSLLRGPLANLVARLRAAAGDVGLPENIKPASACP